MPTIWLFPIHAIAVFLTVALMHTSALAVCPSNCGTTVPGGNVILQAWTLAGSPYCVTGNINVFGLTVEPGVCVLIDGAFTIEVVTTITAIGTEAQPITFTGKTPTTLWKGFSFQNTPDGSEFAYCEISQSNNIAIRIVDSHPLIHDCVVSNNSGPNGAAINAVIGSGDLILRNCTLRNNSAFVGGSAITASLGTGDLVLEECILHDNVTGGEGGAINAQVVDGELRLEDCILKSNRTALGGGAVRANLLPSSTLRLIKCQVEGNIVDPMTGGNFRGGGLYLSGNGNAEIIGGRIVRNSVCCGDQGIGGGIFVEGSGNLTVTGVAIVENTNFATTGGVFGSGVHWTSTGTLSIHNSIIACNSGGSGVRVGAGTLTLTNCTIARNRYQAVFHSGDMVNLHSSILYFNNSAGGNPETWGPQTFGSVTATYSDIQGGGVFPGVGNTNLNPAFVGNVCPCGDFSLIIVSPVRDMGDPATKYDDSCFPPSLGAVRNDMGATGGPGACDLRSTRRGDVNGDWLVNIDDLVQVITNWGPCPTTSFVPCSADIFPCSGGNGVVNIDDLVQVITNWG